MKDSAARVNDQRKFARVRPQNLDTSKLQESLVHRSTDENKPRASYNPKAHYWSDEDEDY